MSPAKGSSNGQGERSQPPPMTGAPRRRLSYSLQRGLGLLLPFSEERQLLGVAELADLAGLSRPTTHRYTSTLVQLGYLEQGSKRKYRLAARAADPGAEIIREIRHALPAREVLEGLRDETGYTTSMGTLDGTRVLYVHRFFGHRRGQHIIDGELRVGAYIPAYCTALGKVMLASLPDTDRRKLVATIHLVPEGPHSIIEQREFLAELEDIDPHALLVSDEEFVLGARSVAMLIARPNGHRPMAIDVTAPSTAYAATDLLKQVGPAVMRASKLIRDAGAR